MKIKILVPIYNDWQSASKLLDEIDNNILDLDHEISVIIINDASTHDRQEEQKDFNNKEMRMNAFYILNELHNSDLVLEENFSPLKVFHNIADASRPVEKDAIEVASNVIKKINEIGIKNVPCHQDLYHANFVIYENKTILIDWEYSSMGDSYFDYADLFWQNEFDDNDEFKKSSLIEIGIESDEDIEKFEYFEMLSMITWGLWALRRSPNDNDGLMAINNAIKLSKIKKL